MHSAEHIERMRAVSAAGGGDAGGGYTPMDGRSYELALLSAGSALTALELVVSGEAENAHAMLRRSGHHAWRDSGYGFCIFNNCAVAARAAQAAFGLRAGRDRRHRRAPRQRQRVDLRGRPERPHGLDPPGPELPERLGVRRERRGGRRTGYERERQPPCRHGRPRLSACPGPHRPARAPALRTRICSWSRCGVDASLFDPLSRLGVTAAGFASIAARLLAAADELCEGRLVSVQEGGYSHVYAPFCWLAVRRDARPCVGAPRGSLRAVHRGPALLPGVPCLAAGSDRRSRPCARRSRRPVIALRLARASRARSSGCGARSPTRRLPRRPERSAARISSCSAIDRSSRPAARSEVLPIRRRTLRRSTRSFSIRLLPHASARMSENAVSPSSRRFVTRRLRVPPGSPATEASSASSTSGRRLVARSRAIWHSISRPQLEDLADVLGRRLEHACSAVRLDLDEAVALEADQRLAHRGLRDAELGRDPCLDELLARLERARR